MPKPRKLQIPVAAPSTKKDHLNAKLPTELKHQMKVYCAQRQITIQDFLIEAIQKAMSDGR
ncbi:MAG: hypothetical protein ABIL58_23165 [Pseudomonadota bacterium]